MKYTLNNVFDHIYILNLKEEKEKYNKTQKKLKKYNIKAKRFEAIDGNLYKEEFEKRKKAWLKNPLNFLKYRKGGSLYRSYGAYGCLLSHIEIIRDAIKKKYKNILILEDDILLHKEFDKYFNNYYHQIKDKSWKFIMLGSSLKMNIIKKKENIQFKNKNYIPIIKYCNGAFAIGIDSSIFQDLLNEYLKFQLPNDVCTQIVLLKKYKHSSFVFKPDLIICDLLNSKTFKNRTLKEGNRKLKSFHWDLLKYDS
jgi:GR25 family glycosyltransferase involved in LPS biosynthesis